MIIGNTFENNIARVEGGRVGELAFLLRGQWKSLTIC